MEEELWELEILIPKNDYDRIVGIIGFDAPYGWVEEDISDEKILFRLYGNYKNKLLKLGLLLGEVCPESSFNLKQLKQTDWATAWRQFFTPVLCGNRFVVLPPWLADRYYQGRKTIIIDPKNAFGTGQHASTALCLTALSNLFDEGRLRKGQWFLDIGCGSGILAIAAEKAGLRGTALDIDDDAISNARTNRELNEADSLEIIKGSVEKVKGEKYDLIMANILAGPLIKMAPIITGLMKREGVLILSGILATQREEVIQAYISQGLETPSFLEEGEWVALIWK